MNDTRYRTYHSLDKHGRIFYQKERIPLGRTHRKFCFLYPFAVQIFRNKHRSLISVYFNFFFSHDLITPFFKIIFA